MPATAFDGFCNVSYTTLSKAESCDETINFYFEAAEVPHTPKSKAALYPRPGCSAFGSIPPTVTGTVRGMIEFDGNNVLDGATFGVSGSTFWQMNPDGSQTSKGSVVDDGLPVTIAANAATVGQIFVASAGHGYCLDTNTGVFAEIPNDGVNFFGARAVTFIDGYFVVLSDTANRQQFQISAINDGTMWSALDVGLLQGQSDQIVGIIANIEYLYFVGSRRGEIWYNSGNALFPFVIESGAFIEVGTNAPATIVQSASTIFYMGQDARGGNMAFRLQGLIPERISTHAVEQAWSQYSTTNDCICYGYTWNGHQFIRYIFPTADAGWDYDIVESGRVGFPCWSKVSFTDENGVQHAPFERAHCYAFGRHLIGSGGADGEPGAIYALSESAYTDCAGSPFGQLINQTQQGVFLIGVLAADTTIIDATWTDPEPVAPFYFIVNGGPATGGELILCTAITSAGSPNQYNMTVLRGQGGSTAQDWAANTYANQVVSAAGFPITRTRICRLPFNNNFLNVLDKLEIFIQPGVGVNASNTEFSGTTTNGSVTVLVSDTTGLVVNQALTGVPVQIETNIVSIVANTSIAMSKTAIGDSGTYVLTALSLTPGANPVMDLSISRDGGVTFGTPITIPMGQSGQWLRSYATRLGGYRDGAVNITITDPVFAALVGASYSIRPGVA